MALDDPERVTGGRLPLRPTRSGRSRLSRWEGLLEFRKYCDRFDACKLLDVRQRTRTALPVDINRALTNSLVSDGGSQMIRDVVAFANPEDVATSLVVIDPRLLIRECLVQALAASYSVTGFASIAEWHGTSPPGGNTILLCYGARVEAPSLMQEGWVGLDPRVKLVVMSDDEDPKRIMDAINDGAKAYIPTNLGLSVVLEIVRLVDVGGSFVPPGALRSMREAETGAIRPKTVAPLTDRQEAVLRAIRMGKPNKIIAYELAMMESTVKVHVRNIMRKTGAKNRTEVAILASSRMQASSFPESAAPKGSMDGMFR
jgi:DNA-binding NarL/FixJ family response regulator